MSNQTLKYKNFSLVLETYDNVNENEINETYLISWLNVNCNFYAFILHDNDLNNETGELKRPHYHIYISLRVRNRFTWVINQLSATLSVSKNIISIEPTISELLTIQYLLHLNDKDKYQYPDFLIETNNREYLNELLYTNGPRILTTNMLISIVEQKGGNKLSILREIGLGNFTKYHRVIEMIINEIFINDNKKLS